jgi:hypothetical protein
MSEANFLGNDFEDYIDKFSLIGGVGVEDWQWLPFTSSKIYEISQVKLSSKEALNKAAKNYGKGFIVFGLILGIIMFLLGA